jgi:CheY-like chemotaxis protein
MSLTSLEHDLIKQQSRNEPLSTELVLAQVTGMKEAGEGALGILDDLLLYERIEKGKLVLNFEILSPVLAVKKMLGLWRKQIDLSLPDSSTFAGFSLRVDINRLKLVFNALLGSLKTRDDTEKLAVHVERIETEVAGSNNASRSSRKDFPLALMSSRGRLLPTVSKAFLRLSIRGLRDKDLLRQYKESFEPTALFKREARIDGGVSGFGMWIARNILELHGAVTHAESESESDETEYIIDFPLSVSADDHQMEEEEQNSIRAAIPSTPSACFHVLVVDDSAMVRRVTSKLVRELGHTFAEAADGEKAVRMIESGTHFDVILMDNQMPVMTGVEATRIIREKHGFKGTILAVTGNALAEDIREFEQAGANTVILKPLTKEAFRISTTSPKNSFRIT